MSGPQGISVTPDSQFSPIWDTSFSHELHVNPSPHDPMPKICKDNPFFKLFKIHQDIKVDSTQLKPLLDF